MVAPYTGAWIETQLTGFVMQGKTESHPIRVRGLKQQPSDVLAYTKEVAPYTGAWIETLMWSSWSSSCPVAPYTGAWIETFLKSDDEYRRKSHPIRVRGLKLERPCSYVADFVVAPYTGAWIETLSNDSDYKSQIESHPIRVRGLKHNTMY